jgi:PAS domain S-box-containing protein
LNITGYTKDELCQLTFHDITHPDDLQADLELVTALLNGQKDNYQMEKRYFHKNGQIIWAILSVSVVRDGTGRALHFVSQITDITVTKKCAWPKPTGIPAALRWNCMKISHRALPV